MDAITGIIQDYAWGSVDGLADALGHRAPGTPQAEYWLGAHPKAPARLADGTDLLARLTEHPEQIGDASVARFGPRLPFLLKVLSARQALSLQAHPSRTQAEEGYAREDAAGIPADAPHRNYRDDWPKPEAMVALTEFHGLCGFRDPRQTLELVGRLGVPEADELFAPLTAPDGLEQVFLGLLRDPEATAPVVERVVAAAEPHAGGDDDFGRFCTTAVEVARDYPGDPGVLAALLLNRILLQPGEAFFMPAGNMHAYLRGTGIEIMSASDNVLRGGLTAKHVDIAELGRVVDFTPGFPGTITPVEIAPGVQHYPTPAPEFDLWQLAGCDGVELPASERARIVLVLEGDAELRGQDGTQACSRGGSMFVPAGETVQVACSGRAFVAA